jgi:hypothetical protein
MVQLQHNDDAPLSQCDPHLATSFREAAPAMKPLSSALDQPLRGLLHYAFAREDRKMRSGIALLTVWMLAAPAMAQEPDWQMSIFAGQLTSNHFEDVFRPGEVDFVDSQMLGVALGRDWALNDSRWTLGLEMQVLRHFGTQDHWEVNLPLILRYHPQRPWPRSLDSLAFGVGPSYATELPEIEIRNDGDTRRSLVYWLLEAEFQVPRRGETLFLRLHHRSDAFGLLEPQAGSNAVVLGYRLSF